MAHTTLQFDTENRLITYGGILTMGYNGDGLRAWKQSTFGGKIYYLYDGTRLLCELDDTGAVTAVNTWGANGLLARNDTWYQFDPQGDVVHRLDANSQVLSNDMYNAFGTLLEGGDSTDPYGYKGQYGYYTDHETGLILCTNRYYDPSTGRWLTRDPISYSGGINLYGYCVNDPLGNDAAGLFGIPDIFAGAMLGAAWGATSDIIQNLGKGALPVIEGALAGTLSGFIAGGICGAIDNPGWFSIIFHSLTGAFGGLLDSILYQALDKHSFRCINWGEVVQSAIIGFVSGGFGGLELGAYADGLTTAEKADKAYAKEILDAAGKVIGALENFAGMLTNIFVHSIESDWEQVFG